MLYERIYEEPGEIFIDGARHLFVIDSIRDGWAAIKVYNRQGRCEGVHNVPHELDTYKAITTSGHRYKLIRPMKRR